MATAISVVMSLIGLVCFGMFVMVIVLAAVLLVKSFRGALKKEGVVVADGIDEREMNIIRDMIARQVAAKKEADVKDMVKAAVEAK